MAEQETLTPVHQFDPFEHGLYRRIVDTDGGINGAAWNRACATHEFVGTCRNCGDYLTPRRPEHIRDRTDYEAECRNTQCRRTINAPAGRVFKRSSRLSERGGRP